MTDLLSETLNRPKAGFCVIVQADQYMSFAGTQDPCAACIIQDFEHFGVEQNKKISKVIMGYLFDLLKIDKRRMYLEFAPVQKEGIGFAGSTFHEFFGPNTCGNALMKKTLLCLKYNFFSFF